MTDDPPESEEVDREPAGDEATQSEPHPDGANGGEEADNDPAAHVARLKKDLARARTAVWFYRVPWVLARRMFLGRTVENRIAALREDLEVMVAADEPRSREDWANLVSTLVRRSPKHALDIGEALVLRALRRRVLLTVLAVAPFGVLVLQSVLLWRQTDIMEASGRSELESLADQALDQVRTLDRLDMVAARRLVERISALEPRARVRFVHRMNSSETFSTRRVSLDDILEWHLLELRLRAHPEAAEEIAAALPTVDQYVTSGSPRQYSTAILKWTIRRLARYGDIPEHDVHNILVGRINLERVEVPIDALAAFNAVDLSVHLVDCKIWRGEFHSSRQFEISAGFSDSVHGNYADTRKLIELRALLDSIRQQSEEGNDAMGPDAGVR